LRIFLAMKLKLLLCLAIGVCHFQLSAQPEKGDVLLGTQFSYFKNKTNSNSDYSEYTFLPSIGIYLSPYFNIGLSVEFFGYNEDVEITDQFGLSTSEEVQLRLNTYSLVGNGHSKITERLYFNTNVFLGFGKGRVNYFDDFESEILVAQLGIRPGLLYFTGSSIVLSAQFAELSYSMGDENIENTNGFSFSQTSFSQDKFSAGLGFEYIQFGISFLID